MFTVCSGLFKIVLGFDADRVREAWMAYIPPTRVTLSNDGKHHQSFLLKRKKKAKTFKKQRKRKKK